MIPLLSSTDVLFAVVVLVGLAALAAGLYVLARTRQPFAAGSAISMAESAVAPGAAGEATAAVTT